MFKYTTFISHSKTVHLEWFYWKMFNLILTMLMKQRLLFTSKGCKVSFDLCTCWCYFKIFKYSICTFKISFSGALRNFSNSVLCRTLAVYSIPYGIRWRDSTIRRRNISVASFSLLMLLFSFIRISSYANASTCVTEYGRFLCTIKQKLHNCTTLIKSTTKKIIYEKHMVQYLHSFRK